MTYAVSTLVVLMLGTGLYFRKRNTTWHRGLMIAAFVAESQLDDCIHGMKVLRNPPAQMWATTLGE